jgi:hypothetical protein
MASMRYLGLLLLVLAGVGSLAGDIQCACESSDPAQNSARQCSLCREADKQSASERYFFLKDINPTKPNRWLILPRPHLPGVHAFSTAPLALRTAVWTAAIEKARSLWGDEWGVAYNGDHVRTQCHAHMHIGKLLPNVETHNFIVVNTPAEIPMPPEEGVWVHQAGKQLHVHQGEEKTELVLMR